MRSKLAKIPIRQQKRAMNKLKRRETMIRFQDLWIARQSKAAAG